MIELNERTVKITIADESVITLIVFKEKDCLGELPVPQAQDYAEMSNLPNGGYTVLHIDSDFNQKLKESFSI